MAGPRIPCAWHRLASGTRLLQTKLTVNVPGDRYEQEADRVADEVLRMPDPAAGGAPPAIQRMCPECEEELVRRQLPEDEEEQTPLQAKGERSGLAPAVLSRTEARISGLRGGGRPLPRSVRGYFEPRFGCDLGSVRVHTGSEAAAAAREVRARAFTVGSDVAFAPGEWRPESEEGRRLLAHELVHTVQQGASSEGPARRPSNTAIQRAPDPAADDDASLIGPLTDREWELVTLWQSRGEVGVDPLTDNPAHNALVVAEAIFCARALGRLVRGANEDPLLCVLPEVTRADPRVVRLVAEVTARGRIVNWAGVAPDRRMLYVMELLVDTHGFPINGAAGLVGNLWSESGVLPSRIEGSAIATPMRAANFAGTMTDFTAEEVMNRDPAIRQGPRRPGVGLAQWTSPARRTGLFQHTYQGRQFGAAILFNMDAQVDYLVSELQTRYPGVYAVVTGAGVSVDAASDEVVYRYEVPGAVLDDAGNLRPRTDPAVQTVFGHRRANAQRALRVYQQAHP